MQTGANVFLLSLTGDTTQNAAPSKQVAHMSSGRPIIASVSEEGAAAEIIRGTRVGVVVPPDDPRALADWLMERAGGATGLEEMGRNARRYAIEHFSKEVLLPKMADFSEEAARESR